MILSAKPGRVGEGGEACHPRSGARQSIQPMHYPHNVHPGRNADLLERRPVRHVTVALANKMARIAWAVMARNEVYRAKGGGAPAAAATA